MSKEVVKAIFDENIAGVREDLTFDAYFDSIKGNEEYKKGLFENYVNDGTKSYEEFNAETFGVGKPEAPSEVGGAESSPTGLGLNESEVGPPAGGTPPGAEPVGVPVSDAIEPIEPVEPEAPAITVGLEEFSVIDNKKDKGFLETIFGWLGGEKTFERVEKPFEELVPARQRLFKKAAAKGFLSTNNLAGYLAGDFKEDNVAREEINKFLEEGVSGQTEAFKRFKGNIDPIIAEQSNEIKETMLKDRAYINLNKEIDREFANQRAEIDAKYIGVINAKEQAKLKEDTVGLLAEYDAVMLSLPTENDVLAKENEMITKYQLLVNDGKMDVDAAKAELQKEYDSYIEDINAKATEAKNAYNSGLEKAAEKIKSGLKDTEEYKQYISELTELRNGIITSREGDLKAIQARIQGDLAPKYNERINSVIRASSSGPTPLLEKSGLLPTIQKVINNKGFDLLPFDQKKAFLDRAFGNVVVQLRSKGVAINDGTIARLRNEYDDAIMSKAYFTQKGAPSLYMLKTRAIEEAEKLDEVIASTKAKTGTKTFTSGVYASEFGQQGKGYDDRDLDQLLLAREKLQEIIDLPENMTDNEFANFWNGLTSGQFVDYLPFVSGLKNLAGSLTLYRSLDDDTPASRYLQNAVALGNSYKGVYEVNNMASDWYKAGAATAESIPFMGEFVFTAGMGSLARKSTEKVVAKLLGEAAEKTVAAKSLRVFAGTLVGSLAQTTANPQRYVDEMIKRMTPQMSIAFSEDGEDLIAMLDESSVEGGFEAALKGFGVTASEYFSENLGFAGARALKYAGSRMMQNEFLKRAYIGWYMSKLNIDMPTAFKRLAEKGGWNGFFAEFGEELANMPLTNLITGDADVMAGILTESGDLDIENLMEVGRALVPISAVGLGVNVGGVAVKSMTPEKVILSFKNEENKTLSIELKKSVWDKVSEAAKSPSTIRDFATNELPKMKLEGVEQKVVSSYLNEALQNFERGVVESTMPPQAKGAAETQPAPKVSVQMKERKKLSADKKRLVGTGKFDFVVTIDGKEQNISRAEYNEYKRSGKLPEGIGADVLGEVDRVEGAVVESTKDAESIKTSLEGVEVPAELGTIENVAEVYEQAKGKEELTDEEVAVVDFVEGNVAKVEGVSEGVVEATPEAETAVSPLQDVESTTKALEGVEQEKLNSVKEKLSKAEISKFESDERKQTTTRADRGVQEVQPPSERDLGGREVSQPDRGFNSVSTGEEWERGEQYNGDGKVPSSNGKPVITVLYHGHKAPFDSFSREYRGSGIGNQGGGVYFLVRPSEALATAERVARFGGYGLNRKETTNSTPFVSKVKIKGNNFVFLDKPIPKDIVAQIGVINGIDPSKYNTYSAFLYDLGMSFVTDKKNFTDHSEAQTKAADELYKKGITGHASSNIKDYEVAVYDESEIEKISQTRIYNSNAELISDQYHKAKEDNSNPELVKAVEDLLGVTPEAVTPEVSGVAEVAEGQPSTETPAKPLTLKEKVKDAEQRAQEDAEKIKKLFRGRNGGLGISPFSRAKRLAEIDKAILTALASYVRNKVLAGAYTFQDFVKDMKENSKRMFGVEIKLTAQDELFFNQSASMYEIDDAFAREIMGLKDDFIFAIPSAPKNAGFKEFVAANQSIVDQFVASAERNYGLNATQANALVESMYQDAVAAAAEQPQTYKTEADIKDYHQKNIASTQKLNAIYNESRAQEIKRRSNLISRVWTSFLKSFISPTVVFNRVFKIGSKRLSLEREVYASRKSRLGASSKAANWYNDMHKKIFGGLSWGELNLLNKYLVYRRIAEVEEMRQKKNIEAKRLREELADPATTDDRKAEINEELAKLGNLDEVKHGSIIVNGKREAILASDARGFVAEINAGTDALSIKIKERAEMYTKANNELLKMRLDAGLISQEAYDSMEKRDYVRRIFLDLSASTIDAVDYPSISDKIKSIQAGSEEKVLEMDTQTLLQLNAAATFDAVAKNNFINKVAKWTESNQQAFLDKALEKFKNKFEKKNGRQPTDDEIQKFLKEQTLFELIRNNQTPKSGFEKVSYFVDGVEKSMAVRSDLANVFRTASGREVAPPWVRNLAKILSYVGLNNLVKLTAVFVNPAFALGNFALDVIHASMVTRDLYKSFSFNLGVILANALGITAENVYSKAVNYGGSLFGIAKRDSKFDRLVKDYFAHGGGMTFMSSSKARMYTDRLSSSRANQALSDFADGLNSVFSALNSIQSGSELITRVIIYEAALEKNIKEYKKQNGIEPTGADLTSIKESAAASAADLIDFREGSNFTKILDQSLFPFLNAMAQGAKAEIEFIRDNPLEAALRVSEFGGMALAVALYNAKSGDDDEKNGIIGYNGVSDYMRSNYFIMMMPYTKQNEKGETVRPFLSFKLPAFLKGVNIFVNGVVSGKSSGQTASMALEAIKGGYVPEIGAASPMTQAVFALKANKDFFRDGQKIYRGREDVLLTDRFNAGETKKVYRDLFDMFYNFSNEDNEDKGLLFFDDAGPAQWQAAVEKAISPNNSYYLFLTASYANLTGLFGEKNSREVDAVHDNMFSALNSLTMRVYRTPQSSVQNKNIKDKEKIEFLVRQIGSWRKKNDDLITSIVSKKLREIDANPNAGARETQILDFFTDGIFEFISDKEIERGIKAQGIKEAPDNYNKMIDFVKEEQSRMANKLYDEFKPGAISAFPSLKNYREIKPTILELEKRTDAINKIRDEYLSLETEKRVDFLVALTFVAGDEFGKIVEIIGADEEEAYDMYTEILNGAEAEEYKIPFLRNEDYSGRISSESALDKMILLQRLMRNE